ncbi:LacI family DNA-binding transcriptional regulator [Staphylococcus saprophyticus]|uniref:LacI family DNA-binding transcriptional regulator n=1 Tax=Staphylococcus saprophyticus TaxID=29385 RepID=UPI0022EA6D4A|nr:LacI family DNA-binding transcriptional regulator [Staphylococcus saprophyticus]MDW4324378.1 LacI family DNA-binding transcriptional regulator [Staphylococcus saprophyticus]MDW4371259.1 LacI family DNA-binding transcriptional regulator [Staphylococcus saprophyticus]MDW4452577.1 LacI family DNA-binding transcriptional regulator [Staphylococcus saprophyticus]MDW4455058.1 LacI family DNA-binding transcriptional regulator [Staphylococcus saprophyticus]MDW4490241.1 LacI family DNA-binding transc
MAVTLKDVAEACGVSYSTVSKALKNSQLVKPNTKQMIQQKALEMNYIPNHSARALVSKKSGTIGLIWPSVDRVAVTHLITEINLAIKSLGYVMFVSIDDVAAASKKFVEFGCDGIVIFDEGETTNLPPEIYNNVPVVAYDVDRDIPYPIVNVNHAEAMIIAIKELLAKGIDRIDYIGDIRTNDARQIAKKDAIANYCEQHRIQYRMIDSSGLNAIEAETSVKHFLQESSLAPGVICGSYDITVGTINAMGSDEQPIIYSYDNIPQIKKIDYPVQAIGVPTAEIAQQVVAILDKVIKGEPIENTYHLHPSLSHNQ